jgi:hypothetical protein
MPLLFRIEILRAYSHRPHGSFGEAGRLHFSGIGAHGETNKQVPLHCAQPAIAGSATRNDPALNSLSGVESGNHDAGKT